MSTFDSDSAEPANTAKTPVVAKVKASTVSAGAIAAIILTGLSSAQSDDLFHGCPDWVTVLVGTLVTVLATFTAGYGAPHTPRPDLPVNER